MTIKLGELLLMENLVSAEQLEDALRQQEFFDIRLGSSLVKMGYVDEDTLARLLSDKLGVASIGRKELSDVPKQVIRILSRAVAAKYHVIPFKLSGNRLSLAMADPTDIWAIDEIAFITGHIVQPFFAPDTLISSALTKYYRSNTLEKTYQRIADARRKQHELAATEITVVSPDQAAAIAAKKQTDTNVAGKDPQPAPAGVPDQSALQKKYTVEQLAARFAAATSREDVADAFIRYLGQEFNHTGLLIVRGTVAVGWRAVADGAELEEINTLNLLLSKPSVVRETVESRDIQMGILVNTPENRLIQTALKLPSEMPLLVMPILILNKVVAAVLVAADMETLGNCTVELQRLARKASLAFEMLIIKNKIMMT